MTNDLTQIYVGQPDIPVGITVSEYRRSRPRRLGWRARIKSLSRPPLSPVAPSLECEGSARRGRRAHGGGDPSRTALRGPGRGHRPRRRAALRTVGAIDYDAIVLDVMMPGLDGFETCRRLRSDGIWVPVLMLTARDSVEDRVRGLDGGADDYLTSPSPGRADRAAARARRRGPVERPAVLEVGDLRLDSTREVWRGDTEIQLSAREFALLETFMRRPGYVFRQTQLLEAAWDLGYEQRSNVVEVYVRYLRQKIDRPFGVASIETVRGAGYRMRKDGGA